MGAPRIFRKRFTISNRNDNNKNYEAMEKVIARYEKKTGYKVDRDGMASGNAMLKFETYADVHTRKG